MDRRPLDFIPAPKDGGRRVFCIWFLYGLALFFFVFKMFFYAEELRDMPDEEAHIGYVCYLAEHPGGLVPSFGDMHEYRLVGEAPGGQAYERVGDNWNYLGHPPLYYQLMKFVSGSEKEGDFILLHTQRMRYFNILLVSGTMALCFYIGYTRIRKHTKGILPHAVYAASAISVPMLAYTGAGVSNDNLAFFGMTLFFWGILRYYEEQIGWATYLLVGAGFFITMLSKLTAGEIVIVALLLVLLQELIQKKGFRVVCNRYFAGTLILYLIPVVYYVFLYIQYGGFQPSLQLLHYDDYVQSTTFYVPVEMRPPQYTLVEYFGYYWKEFLYSWVTLYGNTLALSKVRMYGAWIGPGFIFVWSICQTVREVVRKRKMAPMYVALSCGILVTMVTQFWSAYKTYCSAGYMGGFQARYYLCIIAFFAYGGAMFWCGREHAQKEPELQESIPGSGKITPGNWKKNLFRAMGVLYIGLLLYGDFLYLLLHGIFSV